MSSRSMLTSKIGFYTSIVSNKALNNAASGTQCISWFSKCRHLL